MAEFSEAAFDYLLREILSYDPPTGKAGEDSSDKGEEEDAVLSRNQRLEAMGHDVGHRIVERLVDKQKFLGFEDLDCVKFICREFWDTLFGKKVR